MRKHSFIFRMIVLSICVILFMSWLFTFKISFVEGQSMEPTLRNNQVMLVKKIYNNYDVNDIITFSNDVYGVCVKRIVAIENDEVEIKEGSLYRNGIKLIGYVCDGMDSEK